MKKQYKQGKGLAKINEQRKRKIKCLETNQIFSSLTEAHNILGVNISNLSTHLNYPDKRKSCGKNSNGEKLH